MYTSNKYPGIHKIFFDISTLEKLSSSPASLSALVYVLSFFSSERDFAIAFFQLRRSPLAFADSSCGQDLYRTFTDRSMHIPNIPQKKRPLQNISFRSGFCQVCFLLAGSGQILHFNFDRGTCNLSGEKPQNSHVSLLLSYATTVACFILWSEAACRGVMK